MMVIADQSGAWASAQSKAPLHHGGITKQCWRVIIAPNDSTRVTLEPVPYFWIAAAAASSSGDASSSSLSSPIGVCAFEDDAGKATRNLLQKMPYLCEASGSVGLFPCFTRGVNEYGAENVETRAIEAVFNEIKAGPSRPRIYGMFAHGELGPTREFADFTPSKEANNDIIIPCSQHSHTSILTIHTVFSKE